jgi:hypothetical protein
MFPYQLVFLAGVLGMFLLLVAVTTTVSVVVEKLRGAKAHSAEPVSVRASAPEAPRKAA